MLPSSTAVTKLLQTLRQGGGVASGADLRNALGVSQPTVLRAPAPLEVYDAEYVGQMDNWAATADRMAARGLLPPGDARQLRFLEAYGVLIANDDRLYGNISLLLDSGGDWALSPPCDMLPMRYVPIAGEIVARDFAARNLQRKAVTPSECQQACKLAATFWRTAAADDRISIGFRAIALENRQHLEGLARLESQP